MPLIAFLSLLLTPPLPAEASAGSLRFERGGHSGDVHAIACDPSSGDWLSASYDKTVRRWHGGLPAGPPLRFATGEGVDGSFNALAVSSSGLVAVGEGHHGRAGVWLYDPKRGAAAPVARVLVSGNLVNGLAFSADGKLLAAGDDRGSLMVWRVADRKELLRQNAGGSVNAVAFAPSGHRLAYAALSGSGGKVGVVEVPLDPVPTAKLIADVSVGQGLYGLAWRDDASLAFGGEAGMLASWRVGDPEAKRITTDLDPQASILSVTSSEAGRVLAVGTNAGVALLYDGPGRPPRPVRLAEDGSEVWSVGLTREGRTLVAGLGDGKVCEVDVASGTVTRTLSPASPRVTRIAWSTDGKALRWNADQESAGFDLVGSTPTLPQRISEDDGHRQGELRAGVDVQYRPFVRGDARWAKLGATPAYDAILLDGRRLLVATAEGLQLYDGPGAQPRPLTIDDAIPTGLARSPDGKWIAVGHTDGTLRIYPAEIEGTTPILSLYQNDGEWVVWQPTTGLYDSSVAGDSIFGYQVNQGEDRLAQFVPARLKEDGYRRPGLANRLFRGETAGAVAVPLGKAIADLPQVEVTSVLDGRLQDGRWYVDGETARIRYAVREGKTDQPITVRVNHTGARDVPGLLKLGGDQKTYQVDGLVPGPNSLQLYLGPQKLGVPFTVYSRQERVEVPPRLIVLAIGIGKYKDSSLTLGYPVQDAEGFAETVKAFPCVDLPPLVTVLRDEGATRQRFLDAVDALKRTTKPSDRVMVFIASHGSRQEDGVYVTPYDFDLGSPKTTGIPWSDLARRLADISCRSLVLFSDNCHSGAAVSAFRDAQDAAKREQRLLATDLTLFAACGSDQLSREYKGIGHGLFSAALIAGLRHEILGQGYDPEQGIVTVDSLKEAIQRGMNTIYKNLKDPGARPPSNPQMASYLTSDGVIPLTRVKPAAPSAQGGRP